MDLSFLWPSCPSYIEEQLIGVDNDESPPTLTVLTGANVGYLIGIYHEGRNDYEDGQPCTSIDSKAATKVKVQVDSLHH